MDFTLSQSDNSEKESVVLQDDGVVEFAPILITVYNRVKHFEKCLNALSECVNAKKCHLYIASDNFKHATDRSAVEEVRRIASNAAGFKAVTLIERKVNIGVLENYFDALALVFDEHDRVIFLQDDIIVGKGFIQYMDQALKLYRENARIISICAYIPPVLEGVAEQPFLLKRRSPYGMGMWKEKEKSADAFTGSRIAVEVLGSYKKFQAVAKTSPHIIRALPFIASGDFRAGDYEMAAAMQLNDWLALYPQRSIVFNAGLDGSGVHSGILQGSNFEKKSDEIIQLKQDLIQSEFDLAARLISKHWSFFGHRTVNFFIFIGWNYVPGFYKILKLLKMISVQMKNIGQKRTIGD